MNPTYAAEYDAFLSSGLYSALTADRLLIPHEEVAIEIAAAPPAHRVLRPTPIPFVSHPYEWCFEQLKDAALLTLEIQLHALDRGMTLKDATAFNVQFVEGRPIFIDSLSFERYEAPAPWVAYNQFCRHFLAPLLLMSRVDPRLGRLSALHLDGVPLDLASRLLPRRSWLRPAALLHLHLHARAVRRYGDRAVRGARVARGMTSARLRTLVGHLRGAIRSLHWSPAGTEWADYEERHGYPEADLRVKRELVEAWLKEIRPRVLWDLGANTGTFSRVAARVGARVVAMDADHGAVQRNYERIREKGETAILPLVIDALNPSAAIGWANRERASLAARGRPDVVLALALVHHLAISANVPLPAIAAWLADLAPVLIVEFVPKDDPCARRLLLSRDDIFASYSRADFEQAFRRHCRIRPAERVGGTDRWLYWMEGFPDRMDAAHD